MPDQLACVFFSKVESSSSAVSGAEWLPLASARSLTRKTKEKEKTLKAVFFLKILHSISLYYCCSVFHCVQQTWNLRFMYHLCSLMFSKSSSFFDCYKNPWRKISPHLAQFPGAVDSAYSTFTQPSLQGQGVHLSGRGV